ncbi:DUF4870 domain-containing protein [Candidatus Parcubacteria bacterium]|nr:DUF4870 domain-containing protein [Candidatus Parcubacteria bacterium]
MEEVSKKGQKNILAIISYIGVLCFIPILMKEKDVFVKFHAKQGLVLFIAEVATMLISWIPFLGWLIGFILWIVWAVLSITGIINAVGGKQVSLPIIGKFAEKFKF